MVLLGSAPVTLQLPAALENDSAEQGRALEPAFTVPSPRALVSVQVVPLSQSSPSTVQTCTA
jgi:hypothetical protein